MRLARRFVAVDGLQAHYRTGGSGPAAVLIADAPFSSRSLVPLAEELASSHLVFALDLPGYGASEPLPVAEPSVTDYAAAVGRFLDAVGVGPAAVYGAGAGAAVALEVARSEPARVTALVLDGLLAATDDERRQLLAALPELAPRWDGAHLPAAWSYVRDAYLFAPWFRRSNEARRRVDMPAPEVLDARVLDLLEAVDRHSLLSAAALRYDALAALADVALTPTVVDGADTERIAIALGVDRLSAVPAASPVEAPARHGVTRGYVEVAGGQLALHRVAGRGRPLVLIHQSPLSSEEFLPLMERLAGSRPVIALDIPGNGDSDALPDEAPAAADYARAFGEAIDALGLEEVDLYGNHTGATIALELALLRPELVRNLVLEGFGVRSASTRELMLERYTPPLVPSWDGTHLLFSWSYLKELRLFWPWFEKTVDGIRTCYLQSPDELHRWHLAFLKAGDSYQALVSRRFRLSGGRATAAASGAHTDLLGARRRRLRRDVRGGKACAARRDDIAAGRRRRRRRRPRAFPRCRMRRGYVDWEGRQLHYVAAGAGEPLVLLHKNPSSSEMWKRTLPLLAERFRTIALDTPGYGMSDPLPERPGTMVAYGRAVVGLLDGLGFERASLVGHHTGASVALEVATEYPSRVDRLVLAGLVAPACEAEREERRVNLKHYELDVRGDYLEQRFLERFRAWGLHDPDHFHTELVWHLRAGPDYWWAYEAVYAYDALERLTRVRQPTLFLNADRDEAVFRDTARAAPQAPNSSYVVLAGSSELPYEDPDSFARTTIEFLER